MRLRRLAIFASLLAVGAAVAWFFLNRGGESPAPARSIGESKMPPPPAAADPARIARPPASPALETPRPAAIPTASAVVPGAPLVRTVSTPAPAVLAKAAGPAAAATNAPATARTDGKSELEAVQFMLRDFRTRMGENPVGSNAEIMRAVMGGNEAKARLGPPSGQSLNENGELLDRWGTPYFFHQLSKTSMEVRSAGPDGRLWTADDLVAK